MPVVNREAERELVQKAQARGMSVDQIKQAVTAYRQQASGSSAAPASSSQPKGPGVVQSLAQDLASPFLKTATSGLNFLEGAGDLAGAGVAELAGNKALSQELQQKASLAPAKERNYGYLGSAKPVGMAPTTGNVGKDIATGIKDILGTGLEVGSYLTPLGPEGGLAVKGAETVALPAVEAVGKAAAPAVLKAVKTPLMTLGKFGATQGALSSGGAALQADKGLLDTAKSAVGGALTGLAVGTGAPALGRLASGVGKAAGEALSAGVQKLPETLINNILRPSKNAFRFGKNPGKALAELGIVANSEEGYLQKIVEQREATGEAIGNAIKGLKEVPNISTQKTLEPLEKAIVEAQKFKRTNQPLIGRLESLRDDLLERAGGAENITPQQAFEMKKEIGQIAKWTGQAFDNELNQARVGVYQNIKKDLEKAANEQYGHLSSQSKSLKKLNELYGNLVEAQSALENRISIAQRNNLISLPDLGVTSVATAATGGLGGLLALGIKRGLETTAVKTRVASMLASVLKKIAPEEQEALLKALPSLETSFGELPLKEKEDFIQVLPILSKLLRSAVIQKTTPQAFPSEASSTQQ